MSNKGQKKFRFKTHLFLVIFLTIVSAFALERIAVNIEVLNPFNKALSDFDVTDMAFTKFRKNNYIEQEVVLVNIGHLNRFELSRMIDSLSKYKPSVIGIDAFFSKPKNAFHDFKLRTAIQNAGNVVLVSKVDGFNEETGLHDSLVLSAPLFSDVAQNAFANLVTGGEDGFRTSREISLKEQVQDSLVYSFPSILVKNHDPDAFENLKKREPELEVINWVGNNRHFYRLDYPTVLNGGRDLSVVKDRIVLLGYLGIPLGRMDLEDVFFTPMNENFAGRAIPDMFGVTIHANAISMMLNNNYVNHNSDWSDYVLALIILLLNSSLFLWIAQYRPALFELASRAVQILQFVILTALSLYSLAHWNYKINAIAVAWAIALSADFVDIYHSSFSEKVENWLNRKFS